MPDCQHCHGRGWYPVPQPSGAGAARRCSCRQRDLRSWLQRVGVPPVVLADALEPWNPAAMSEPGELWEWAGTHAWATGGPVGWLICGAPGRGKSKAAALALGRAARGRWYECPAVVRKVFAEAREMGFSPTRTLMLDAPFAVLDDFGAEGFDRGTEEARSWIWSRYTARKPTVVTTNLEPSAVDERLRSRMADWRVIRMTGDDYRIRRAANL